MASDYDCPYGCETAIRWEDEEEVEGTAVTCRSCGRRSRLALVPQPTARHLDAREWVLVPDEDPPTGS